jgi:hypothetical protein
MLYTIPIPETKDFGHICLDAAFVESFQKN